MDQKDTPKLRRFAKYARRTLMELVGTKLDAVLKSDSLPRREHPKAAQALDKALNEMGRDKLIDKVAYLWFNRFCAFRYMDVKELTRIRVVSPNKDYFQPEILAQAKAGDFDPDLEPFLDKTRFEGLLNGTVPAAEPQQEAYRMLLVASCNQYHSLMPFLFERIEDYSELLIPDDLLSQNSILAYTREALVPATCESVEVIGWLYQYYISEKKDDVFEGLKKNQKISAENIPAATQLFTPDWIVRYMVQNSLGRLWMLNHPDSPLANHEKLMDCYITPAQSVDDYLRIASPQEIKLCDPACGSGHILVFAFDLLYEIYRESHFEDHEIPGLILQHNLYGMELDERAAELAAFALVMKAAERLDARSFRKGKIPAPHITVFEDVSFSAEELKGYMKEVGADLFTSPLERSLQQFADATNFGSLIQPVLRDCSDILPRLQAKKVEQNLFLTTTHEKVLKVLPMLEALSPRYHCVVANPPYMGSKGMNDALSKFAKSQYPESKADLFAMFMERNLELTLPKGLVGMVTMQSWMFLSSFEKLRETLLTQKAILSMAHLGARGFDSIGGEVVQTTAFVLGNQKLPEYKGSYLRLVDGKDEDEKLRDLKANRNGGDLFFHASSVDFAKIPSLPLAYWVSDKIRNVFHVGQTVEAIAPVRQGFQTGDNDRFMRYWFEVSNNVIGFEFNSTEAFHLANKKFAPYNKGGAYRKWFGNNDYIVAFDKPNFDLLAQMGNNLPSRNLYFKQSITWSALGGIFGARLNGIGFTFSAKGACAFPENRNAEDLVLSVYNSKVTGKLLEFLSPTLDFNVGPLRSIPLPRNTDSDVHEISKNKEYLVKVARCDWDSFEDSWDFSALPLLQQHSSSLSEAYAQLRQQWIQSTCEMKRLEEENNHIFIEAYGLGAELDEYVPWEEITLTCNPWYRYGAKAPESSRKSLDFPTDADLDARLQGDTVREFLSYAVGCMFGRYSPEKPGLILANQGEGLEDFHANVPGAKYLPDDDNIIPLMEDLVWFADDMVEKFKAFLKFTFGEERYEENLRFIEDSLYPGKKKNELRDYFVGEFYKDHLQRYKKRPIYWMCSSPKGSFNALIYMHRYGTSTLSRLRSEYVQPFLSKLEAARNQQREVSISATATAGEKTKAIKQIDVLSKKILDVTEYEKILYELITDGLKDPIDPNEKLKIDLDDGVKKNYLRFGKALKAIAGLDKTEE